MFDPTMELKYHFDLKTDRQMQYGLQLFLKKKDFPKNIPGMMLPFYISSMFRNITDLRAARIKGHL